MIYELIATKKYFACDDGEPVVILIEVADSGTPNATIGEVISVMEKLR